MRKKTYKPRQRRVRKIARRQKKQRRFSWHEKKKEVYVTLHYATICVCALWNYTRPDHLLFGSISIRLSGQIEIPNLIHPLLVPIFDAPLSNGNPLFVPSGRARLQFTALLIYYSIPWSDLSLQKERYQSVKRRWKKEEDKDGEKRRKKDSRRLWRRRMWRWERKGGGQIWYRRWVIFKLNCHTNKFPKLGSMNKEEQCFKFIAFHSETFSNKKRGDCIIPALIKSLKCIKTSPISCHFREDCLQTIITLELQTTKKGFKIPAIKKRVSFVTSRTSNFSRTMIYIRLVLKKIRPCGNSLHETVKLNHKAFTTDLNGLTH